MGQRQSSPQQQEEQPPPPPPPPPQRGNSRERVIRPSSRTQVERTNPIQETSTPNIQLIPVNDNQRREQRRQRRAARREQRLQREEQEMQGRSSPPVTMANVTNVTNANTSTSLSPFARMLAQVISEAVVTSFRSGQIPLGPQTESNEENNHRNIRQQLTMHLSPELFQQMEPDSDENSFMRFMRLPVVVTHVAANESPTTGDNVNSEGHLTSGDDSQINELGSSFRTERHSVATVETVNAVENERNSSGQPTTPLASMMNNNESEATRILMLPVFLYGIRSSHHVGIGTIFSESLEEVQPQRRQSQRIRERLQRERQDEDDTEVENQQEEERPRDSQTNSGPSSGQWTVYIISGNSVENIMSEHNPTYEELLDLASIVGPARRMTVSQEAIDSHVPIVKYTQQVKQSIIGNSEGCQVCLNTYQFEEDIRILVCHHGFHKECIDKWLTEGQNQCPLCRKVPVPSSNRTSSRTSIHENNSANSGTNNSVNNSADSNNNS
ncbi:hypothetical protein G6F56_009265 [Rhizopus delemar]|nr:hypothetical protein G6F56_009265 [Rhizopus delemar]